MTTFTKNEDRQSTGLELGVTVRSKGSKKAFWVRIVSNHTGSGNNKMGIDRWHVNEQHTSGVLHKRTAAVLVR